MQKVLLILGELSDADVDWLAEVGEQKPAAAGTILIYEGKPADALYILLDGTLVVSISALEGRQIARLATGEVVGEMSFIDDRLPSATVQTLEDSTVLMIPRAKLTEKLTQDVEFAARFYRSLALLLSHRLRVTVKQLGDLRTIQSQELQQPEEPSMRLEDLGLVDSAIAHTRFERLLSHLNSSAH